jgi:hypothetical protein
MDNDDIIEVMTEQIGGNGKLKVASTQLDKYVAKEFFDSRNGEISFVVDAVEVGGRLINEMEFVIGPNVKVEDFMDAWAERAGCALCEVVFRYTDDKEGPGLPFESEDDTFGDVSQAQDNPLHTRRILTLDQGDFMVGDQVFVNAFVDEPVNLVRPREKIIIKKVNIRPETPEDTILITVKYLAQDDVSREIHCKTMKTVPFGKFIALYSKRWDIDASAQRLTFNGKNVFPSDTPASVSHTSCAFTLTKICSIRNNYLHILQIGAEHGAVLNIVEDSDFFAMDLTLG